MIPVCDITKKILSCDSNYIVDVVMWPKFGNSLNESSYHNLNVIRIWSEKPPFLGVFLVEGQ